jgi:multidrug efflux pump subunit AcrA (membrane-fusion protein)
MEVRVNVKNAGNKLKPGMFAKVRIITERKQNIVKIPATAMIARFEEYYVYVVVKDPENAEYNIVRKRKVVPGILIDEVREILDGLEENDEIVIRGQTLLEDGARVNIIDRFEPISSN